MDKKEVCGGDVEMQKVFLCMFRIRRIFKKNFFFCEIGYEGFSYDIFFLSVTVSKKKKVLK